MFQLKTIHIIDFRFHSNTVTMLQYHCDTVHLHLTICTVFTPKLKTCVSVCVCVWGGDGGDSVIINSVYKRNFY